MTRVTASSPGADGPGPGDRRTDVLRVLREASAPMSIVQVADRLGVHPNTVRFHLETLARQGRVEQVAPDRRRPGRPPLLFRAVRGMDPAGQRRYRLLAEILVASVAADPDPSARAADAGRAWGRALAPTAAEGPTDEAPGTPESARPIDRLVGLLDQLGFAPERRGTDTEVGLRNCPFLELAQARAQVVCPIHLGLMQGALGAWAAPITVDRLDAFVEPDLCLAHLAPAGAR
ncbi:MAG TPA: helix-turn-helix domain-containing protein [Nakamurella sp.]